MVNVNGKDNVKSYRKNILQINLEIGMAFFDSKFSLFYVLMVHDISCSSEGIFGAHMEHVMSMHQIF